VHSDPLYARTTQFGEPIIFGVAVVLAALGRVFPGRQVSINTIRAVFLRPVFAERDYRIESTVKAGVYSMAVRDASGVQVRVRLSLGPDRVAGETHAAHVAPPPVTDRVPRAMRYSLNWGGYSELCRRFDLPVRWLPPVQMNALLWSSYFVGMINPGVQALLTTLEFCFDADPDSATAIELRDLEYERDERFNMLQDTGAGTGISRFSITAMSRPLPVRYSMREVTAALTGNGAIFASAKAHFDGKRVFVSGGSRGLGFVFARGLATLGAVVVAACRHQSDDADALRADLVALNPASRVLVADLADVSAFRCAVDSATPGAAFDALVLCASPVIKPAVLAETDGSEVMDFVGRSLNLFLTPLKTLLPRIAPGSRIVVISSAYAARPEAKYGHYVAAKRAIEGLTEVVAKEYPAVEFLVFRPGRFLSDQTNAPVEQPSLRSAIDIFQAFLDRLREAKRPGESNIRFFDS